MKYFFLFFFLSISLFSNSQKLKKTDKILVNSLQQHVFFLADDKLEGRRTGTTGEKLAYEYIVSQFKNNGLLPRGDNGTYIQEFEVNEGKQINSTTHLIINGTELKTNTEYFPFVYSSNTSLEAAVTPALREDNMPWFWDLKEIIEENKANPHFNLEGAIYDKAAQFLKHGTTALFVYNSDSSDDGIKFNGKDKSQPLSIPVIYLKNEAVKKILPDESATYDVKLKVLIEEKKRKGHNVVGYLDNGAATTIVLGAHYDHLGYGEDKNSLNNTGVQAIHNGADDNASGTAALIELSKRIISSKFKNNNYLFIAFSGEELGLYGSKYYVENPTIDISKVNYMLNMDMVGRLSDSAKITVGGYGTSPYWGQLFSTLSDKNLKVKFDSSGSGPSDHTSFYRKNIPVLFFFTGTHSDYHKPSDDADKINYIGEHFVVKYIYKIIEEANNKGKLAFAKTREQQVVRSSFSVSLGIMPDYTYSGSGVRVDGVSEGKLAQKLGIKAGDVIVQLGDIKFTDVTSYMQALSRFKKGESTIVRLKRGQEEIEFAVTF
ncbi:MAG TPA: M20/M25/M40 family metallo-hydrolase [Chitinophagaceae bacterium]|nr:M20/M25/M40 family metallo-hydrolase [Chitinophagaceae bacterium]